MKAASATSGRIHFWTDRDVEALMQWDPDLEPHLHASGYGHTFAELYVRLRRRRRDVSIGPTAAAGTTVIVSSLEELTNWLPRCEPSLLRAIGRDVVRTHAALVVVRADVHPDIPAPDFTALQVVPTPRAVGDTARHVYLPLLPQRGLRPRSAERGDQVVTVVLKAYRKNIPTWLTEEFASRLSSLGLALRIDTEDEGSRSWADFSDVDVALCSQPSESLGIASRKPPTKLINAWRAGTIPLVVPVLPYAEIGRKNQNMLTVDGPEEVLQVLQNLLSQPEWAASLFAESRVAGASYGADDILDLWERELNAAVPVPRRAVLRSLAREYGAAAIRRLSRRHVTPPAPSRGSRHG